MGAAVMTLLPAVAGMQDGRAPRAAGSKDDAPEPRAPAREAALTGAPRPPAEVAAQEDLDLCTRAAQGEMRAFNLLVRRYQGRVFGMSVRMLGDAAEAEDVAQEVFVALHGALGSFRGESRVSTWVFRITRNHCLNRLKFLSRRGRRLMGAQAHEDGVDPLDAVQSPDPGPLAITLAAQDGRRVEAALQKLTPDHRSLVLLREVEQLSYDEIADITGLAEGTIKSRLHRARASLLQHLPDLGADG
jgi:RNA polymerase sigma-70 factor (ECF subfamily)